MKGWGRIRRRDPEWWDAAGPAIIIVGALLLLGLVALCAVTGWPGGGQ